MLALGNMDCRSAAAEDGTYGSAKDCVLGNWVIWNHPTQWPSLVWLESNFTYRIRSQDTAVPVTAAGVACSHTPGVTCGACHSTAVTNQLTRSTAAGYVRRLRDLSSAMFCWMLAAVVCWSKRSIAFSLIQRQIWFVQKKQKHVSITGCLTLIITCMSYWLLQVIWSVFMSVCFPFNKHEFTTLNPRVWGLCPKALCHTAAQKKHGSNSTASQNPQYSQNLHNTNPKPQ